MEAGSGGMLRLLRGHTRAVHACQFTPHNKHLATGGDDQIIKYWDVSSGQCILDMQGHSDHVRCMATNPASADVLATGSYDHTVRPPTLLARYARCEHFLHSLSPPQPMLSFHLCVSFA